MRVFTNRTSRIFHGRMIIKAVIVETEAYLVKFLRDSLTEGRMKPLSAPQLR